MVKPVIYLDGHYVSIDAQLLEFFAPGTLPWQGVFETLRCLNGKIEFLDEHLNRLTAGLKASKIRPPCTIAEFKHMCGRVLKKNPSVQLGRLRLMIFKQGRNVHCLAMLLPYQPPSAQQYRRGLKVKLVRTNRPATARFANIKSLDYRIFADAYRQAKAAGCDEALLINRKGHVFEASRANIFITLKGRLLTPPLSSGCLNGIIRQYIIKEARDVDVPVLEQNITPQMIREADKIFLTNSLIGIIAIGRVAE